MSGCVVCEPDVSVRSGAPALANARGGVMKSPVAHWGAGEWRKSPDDLAPDPAHPQAFPSKYPMDLMGRIRVKLCAEDGNLVAYGFGGQRVALPAEPVRDQVRSEENTAELQSP